MNAKRLIALVFCICLILALSADGFMASKQTVVRLGLIGKRLDNGIDEITQKPVEGFKELIKNFEKQNPGIKVEFVPIPAGGGPGGWQARSLALLLAGEVDVIEAWGLYALAQQGLLENLDPYIAKDKYDMNRFVPHAHEVVRWWAPGDKDLHYYGLHWAFDTRVIAYDKKIFDACGVEYLHDPPTIEELTTKIKQFAGKTMDGKKIYPVWITAPGCVFTWFEMVHPFGGKTYEVKKGGNWEMTLYFDSNECLETTKWLKEMFAYCPPEAKSFNSLTPPNAFTDNNNVAIVLETPVQNTRIIQMRNNADRFALVQSVKGKDGRGGMFSGMPLAMAKFSRNKAAAWKLMKFMVSDAAQLWMFQNHGLWPATKKTLESNVVKATPYYEVIAKQIMTVGDRPKWMLDETRYILQAELENVLNDRKTPEEAMKTVQEKATEWYRVRGR